MTMDGRKCQWEGSASSKGLDFSGLISVLAARFKIKSA